jgi:phospholipid transport system substrate-binding protein
VWDDAIQDSVGRQITAVSSRQTGNWAFPARGLRAAIENERRAGSKVVVSLKWVTNRFSEPQFLTATRSGRLAETLPVQPMRAVSISVIQALAWLAVASGFGVAPIGAAEPITATAPPGPREVMSDLSTRLFASLDKESAKTRRNADKIRPLIDALLSPHFDMEYAARLVLGIHWRGATPEQRQQFGIVLYQRLLRTYAGAFAEWTPDRFKLLPLRADPEALQVTVHTLVTNSRRSIVPFDFRMRLTPEGWKIFDVTVDGVSYVRIYHDDINEEITQKGIDASIARLAKSDPDAVDRVRSPNSHGAH